MGIYAAGENLILHLHEDPEETSDGGIVLPNQDRGLRRGEILSIGTDVPEGTFAALVDVDDPEIAVFPKGAEVTISGGLAVINYKRVLCTEIGED